MNLENTELKDFVLKNQDDKDIRLSDFRGKKVLIYFYPKDGTPGCTLEAKGFRDLAGEFAKVNTEILGISKDSKESHCKFIEKYNLNYNLLVDENLEVAKQLGAVKESFSLSQVLFGLVRSTLLVNEQGIVIKHWETIKDAGTHPQEILDYIKSLG